MQILTLQGQPLPPGGTSTAIAAKFLHIYPRPLLGISLERGKIGGARGLGGEFQGCRNVLGRQLRPGSHDLFRCIAVRDASDNHTDRDARAFDARLAVMDARIDADPVAPIHVKLTCGRTRSANSYKRS